MSDPDVHTLTGAYSLDALDGPEREAFEAHLRTCAACREEVAGLTAAASRLADAASARPPADLRARVLAEVAGTRQLSPLPEVTRLDEHRARRWYTQPATAAAALLLVVTAGTATFAVNENRRAERAEQRAEQVVAIATDPQRVEVTQPASSGGSGTVVAAEGSALFRARDLPRLPDDRVYQLWRIRGEAAQSIGVLGRGGALEALVADVAPTDSLGLTVEPDGGSESPTGELVLRFALA